MMVLDGTCDALSAKKKPLKNQQKCLLRIINPIHRPCREQVHVVTILFMYHCAE